MKRIILTLTIMLIATLTCMAKSKVIKNPMVEHTPSWISVYEVELSDEATILRCKLGSGCRIMSNSMLVDRKTGKEYKFIKVEGVAVDNWVNTSDGSRSDCALFFEPVGKDVKEVNYIERETVKDSPDQQVYGISLVPAAKKSKMKVQSVCQTPTVSDTAWRFSNERYKDMQLYKRGKARLNIHIERIPKELREMTSTMLFSVIYEEQVLRKETIMSAKLDDNDCAIFDLDLPGPTFVYIREMANVLVQPGDTLDVFTTLERDENYDPRYIRYEGNCESAQINTLMPELIKTMLDRQYGRAKYREMDKSAEEGKESVEKLALKWGNMLDSIATSEEVRKKMQATPLSTFGKDLSTFALLAELAIDIHDLIDKYSRKNYIHEQMPDGSYRQKLDSTWVPLDYGKIYESQLKHKALLYDNPLALSSYDQWVFINRTIYSALFFSHEIKTDEQGNTYGVPVDKYGLSGTFMWDISKSQNLAYSLKYLGETIQTGKMTAQQGLDAMTYNVAEKITEINNNYVARIVLEEYRSYVRKYEAGAKDDGMNWTDEQKALWQKLTSPYTGNILYIDFWGMGCGPCRSGMIEMRRKVEAMKDEPMRFLYVCDEKHSPRDESEKWMTENNIKGEHIYVSHAEWTMLETMFTFNSIPHAVLAGKDGKVIQNDFEIHSCSIDDLKAITAFKK